ncbi:MAG: prephenate dehydrogenase/arogenate dehydrogenase family protein, partial [Candidatus Bathyarchaeota archaeon]
RPGAVLAEIASLKIDVIEPLKEASGRRVKPLCLHPMFGPSIRRLDNKTVAVIPINDKDAEKRMGQKLFPGADLLTLEAKTHDRCMAAILSLPYLMNLAYAGTLTGFDLGLLSKLGGSTFALQYTLSQSIVGENTDLVRAILYGNSFLDEHFKQFASQLKEIFNSVSEEDRFSSLHGGLKTHLQQDPGYRNADERRRKAFNTVKNLEA